MRRLESLEFLRGCAVILVVLYHLLAVQNRYFNAQELPAILKYGYIGVDIFFIISGAVIFLASNQLNKFREALSFWTGRIIRIYPSYWLITMLILSIYVYEPKLVNSSYTAQPSLIKSFLLLPDDTKPWLNVGWSLIYELWFYIFAAGLILVPNNLRKYVCTIYCCVVVLFCQVNFNSPVLNLVLSNYIIEFFVGYMLGAIIFNNERNTAQFIILFIMIFTMCTSCILLADHEQLIIFMLSVIIFCVVGSVPQCYFKSLGLMLVIGRVSYSIYLTHVISLNGFFVIMTQLPLENYVLISNAVCVVFVIWVGYLFDHMFDEKIRKWYSLYKASLARS